MSPPWRRGCLEGVRARLAVRSNVIGLVEVAPVDLLGRYKSVDVNDVGGLHLDRVQLLRLDLDVLALRELVAAPLVVLIDNLAGTLIDHLLA